MANSGKRDIPTLEDPRDPDELFERQLALPPDIARSRSADIIRNDSWDEQGRLCIRWAIGHPAGTKLWACYERDDIEVVIEIASNGEPRGRLTGRVRDCIDAS